MRTHHNVQIHARLTTDLKNHGTKINHSQSRVRHHLHSSRQFSDHAHHHDSFYNAKLLKNVEQYNLHNNMKKLYNITY